MKKKITITATDKIGRTESITMILPKDMANDLYKASKTPDNFREMNDLQLKEELKEIYENYEKSQYYSSNITRNYKPIISKKQYYKLRNFYDLIYHKFYTYTLSITINHE